MNQRKNNRRRWLAVLFAVIAVGFVVWLLLPSPLEVDLQAVSKGPLMVTIDEEGETRAKDRYVISAPVNGRLLRIAFDEGDEIAAGRAVAFLQPLPLGKRETLEIQARLEAAEAAGKEAEVWVRQARLNWERAKRERERVEQLFRNGLATRQEWDFARDAENLRSEELEAARLKAQAAAFEIKAVRSGLLALEEVKGESKTVPVLAPASGRVLKVLEKSERVVQAGTPLLVIGDPSRLEVVIDLLTEEAVRVRPGQEVLLERWGGEGVLKARVRRVEPWGFTKVSALGVEEKRVHVVADFLEPPPNLGDGFRVEAKIVLWRGEEVLKIPSNALFRVGKQWAVFVNEKGRAKRRLVEMGRQGTFDSEIVKGLKEGEEILLHPSNRIREGLRIVGRKS